MFKIGDKVECVDPIGDLTLGKTYTVCAIHYAGEKISLEEKDTFLVYYEWRFSLIEEPQKKSVLKSHICMCGIYRNDCVYHKD
jgi:hypothetical protein